MGKGWRDWGKGRGDLGMVWRDGGKGHRDGWNEGRVEGMGRRGELAGPERYVTA